MWILSLPRLWIRRWINSDATRFRSESLRHLLRSVVGASLLNPRSLRQSGPDRLPNVADAVFSQIKSVFRFPARRANVSQRRCDVFPSAPCCRRISDEFLKWNILKLWTETEDYHPTRQKNNLICSLSRIGQTRVGFTFHIVCNLFDVLVLFFLFQSIEKSDSCSTCTNNPSQW